MIQPDLFKYPEHPGFKARDTSRAAADSVAEKAPNLRDQVLAAIKSRDMCADAVARQLGKSILSIRPRLSELVAKGLIEDTGRRTFNESGKRAIVWRAKE